MNVELPLLIDDLQKSQMQQPANNKTTIRYNFNKMNTFKSSFVVTIRVL